MKLAIAVLAVVLASCSGESAKNGTNNGWQLGDGVDAGQTSGNNGAVNNGSSNNGTTAANNGTTAANNGTTAANNGTTAANNGTSNSTNNTGGGNNGTTGMTTNTGGMSGSGMGAEGDNCGLNSDCGADLTCCPGIGGNPTCETRCRIGGLCGGMDSECSGNTECCDLSGINQPDACLRNCPSGGGNGGAACMANSDCPSTEVCCQGFDGNTSCRADCFTGGVCEVDADCRNGQLCCDFQVAKACLDQCNF